MSMSNLPVALEATGLFVGAGRTVAAARVTVGGTAVGGTLDGVGGTAVATALTMVGGAVGAVEPGCGGGAAQDTASAAKNMNHGRIITLLLLDRK